MYSIKKYNVRWSLTFKSQWSLQPLNRNRRYRILSQSEISNKKLTKITISVIKRYCSVPVQTFDHKDLLDPYIYRNIHLYKISSKIRLSVRSSNSNGAERSLFGRNLFASGRGAVDAIRRRMYANDLYRRKLFVYIC